MVNRIIRDDPSKGDMHNRQALSWSLFWEALKDYDMWPIYLIGLSWGIPQQPSSAYITLILKGLGFDTFTTNLLTVPAYVLFIMQALFWAWLSEKFNSRFLIILVAQLWCLPLVIALKVLPGGSAFVWARYVLNFLLIGFPYIHPILGEYDLSRMEATIDQSHSGHDLSQRRLSQDSNGRVCLVQHERSDVEYYKLERKTTPITDQRTY